MATAWAECDRTGLGGRTVNRAHGKPAATGGHAIVPMPAMALPR